MSSAQTTGASGSNSVLVRPVVIPSSAIQPTAAVCQPRLTSTNWLGPAGGRPDGPPEERSHLGALGCLVGPERRRRGSPGYASVGCAGHGSLQFRVGDVEETVPLHRIGCSERPVEHGDDFAARHRRPERLAARHHPGASGPRHRFALVAAVVARRVRLAVAARTGRSDRRRGRHADGHQCRHNRREQRNNAKPHEHRSYGAPVGRRRFGRRLHLVVRRRCMNPVFCRALHGSGAGLSRLCANATLLDGILLHSNCGERYVR